MIKMILRDVYDVLKAKKEVQLEYLREVAKANKKAFAQEENEIGPYRSTRIGFGSSL
jgi:hypothetical protein